MRLSDRIYGSAEYKEFIFLSKKIAEYYKKHITFIPSHLQRSYEASLRNYLALLSYANVPVIKRINKNG